MDIRRVVPDDRDSLVAYAAVANAASTVDAPWQHPLTPRQVDGMCRHGVDGEPSTAVVGTVDGEPVAAGWLTASDYDNVRAAWLSVQVRPDRRRGGLGTRLLDALVGEAGARGRTTVGTFGWEGDPAAGFAAVHGFEPRSRTAQRRQVLADVDWRHLEALNVEARGTAHGYVLTRRVGATPEPELPALAALTATINDAPTDELDWEAEAFPAARVRSYERAWRDRGCTLHRVVARHRRTGELGGHTVVVVDGERPELGEQHDTAVAPAHRGHRLGILLKTEMNLWLRRAQPQLASIDTWNAASNTHMVAVNEELGYRVVGREVLYQRP